MKKKRKHFLLGQYLKDCFFTKNAFHLDDRFVLRDGKRHPFALICPGGAYKMVCSFIEGVPVAKELNKLGISAFILTYRTKDKARFPAPQEDLAAAVRMICAQKDRYMVDTDTYSIWGFSAGGHLVSSFGTETMGYLRYNLPEPACIILGYPVISMRKNLTHMDTHDNHLGKDASEEQEALTSADEHVTEKYPPVYIWCGDADRLVSIENTKNMASALTAAGVSHQCEIFPDADHGIGPGEGTSAEGWIRHAAAFWEEQIQKNERGRK